MEPWLPQAGSAPLDGVDLSVVGQSDWRGLLLAAYAQNASLGRDDERRPLAVRAVRDRLLLRRTLTPLDRSKSERIARDLVSDLAPHAGTASIRLTGHGGSGKTTAIVLLATRLAAQYDARVIVLTFHHALRGDIRHVFESMLEAQGFDWNHVLIEEAQDWTDAERDLLIAVYGSWRMVFADGRDLIGGRVVVLEGELDANALVRAFGAVAVLGKADPVDNLICVPHSEIVRAPGGARHAKLAAQLLANGERVWMPAVR